jgi:hypothetical protein
LNAGVARTFHRLFPRSELFLLAEGRHFVQIDEPEQVSSLILTLPRDASLPVPTTQVCPLPTPWDSWVARLTYIAFSASTLLLAPAFLLDRWRVYRQVQRVFQRDSMIGV